MRIVVTGGAGFIGSHVVEYLVRERVGSVLVLDNLHRGRLENLASCREEIDFIEGDIRNPGLMRQVMRGAEVVFHLAAQSSVLAAARDNDYAFSTNVVGTFNVLAAAREAGVRRVVLASSREVYGEPEALPVPESAPLRPKNAYGASKVACEVCSRSFAGNGLETAIVRLSNVYGPRDAGRVIPICIEKALSNQPLILYGGNQVLDFVWIDTVVEALMKTAFGSYIDEPLNIGSGKETSISSLSHRILNLTKSDSRLCFAPARALEVVRFVADVTKARQCLSLELPQDPLFALGSVVEWVRKQIRREEIRPVAEMSSIQTDTGTDRGRTDTADSQPREDQLVGLREVLEPDQERKQIPCRR